MKQKHNFNFIRISNWLYLARTKLKKLRERLDEEEISDSQAIQILEQQKLMLLSFKDILTSKTILTGIQPEFLANFKQIKKDYGIED